MNQPRRPPADEKRVEKHSKNDEANEIFALLREAALRLVKLGDELEAVKEQRDSARRQLAGFEEWYANHAGREEELDAWEELLDDFRLGIRDRDELLARTIGP